MARRIGGLVISRKMGESIQEGKVLRWLKKPGDTIERDEILLEISTDKVDTEVPSPVAGTLSELKAQEGDTVEVGTVIALISSGKVTVSNQSNPIVAAAAPVQAPSIAHQSPIVHAVEVPTPIVDIPRQSGSRFYSPLVRSIAEVEKVILSEIVKNDGPAKDGDPAYLVAESKLANTELGWISQFSLNKIIEDSYAFNQALNLGI